MNLAQPNELLSPLMSTMLDIPATDKTPAVRLDPNAGMFQMTGCSIHENADAFFAPIFDHIDAYAKDPKENTLIRIDLVYFNTSSAKYLLDILKQFEDLHCNGTSKVQLEWLFEEGDLDMEEAGEDYQTLLEIPVKLVQKED